MFMLNSFKTFLAKNKPSSSAYTEVSSPDKILDQGASIVAGLKASIIKTDDKLVDLIAKIKTAGDENLAILKKDYNVLQAERATLAKQLSAVLPTIDEMHAAANDPELNSTPKVNTVSIPGRRPSK